MDYTEIPRSLIYEDLNDLKYFEVKTPKTINAELFLILKKELLRYTTEAKKYALECFNNAYYICTLVLLEEYPELSARKYQNNVLIKTQEERPDYDICAASMGLAYHLLSRCDDPKCSNKELLDNIYLSFKTGEFTSLQARNTFFDIVDKYDVSKYSVPSSLFAPRDIIRAVAHATEKDLVHGKEYIYERSCLLNDIRREDYLLENIIKRLKEKLHKIYDDYEYDENEKIFCDELTNEKYKKFNNAVTPIIEAIKYYENCISFNHIGLDTPIPNNKEIQLPKSESMVNADSSEQSKKTDEQKEELSKVNTTINQLINQIKDLEDEIADMKKRVGIDAPQIALLVRIVLSNYGGLPNNRENAWPIMANLWGCSETNAKKRLREKVKENTVETLASLFESVSPKIKKLILDEGEKIIAQQK